MNKEQFGETPEITAAKKRLDENLARYIDADEYKKWKARRRKA